MSGHSKWAQIKRQKGVTDIKRGQAFTKIANGITIAVRQAAGSTDPNQNFRLRLAIEKARAANMPKENIEKAIERGKGVGEGAVGLEEVVYEGFAPGGAVAVIVEAATDNKQRTTAEIKNIFEKAGAVFGQPGSVAYRFEVTGAILLSKSDIPVDEIMLLAADAGAQDLTERGDEVVIYTKPEDLNKVRSALLPRGLAIKDAELIRRPLLTQTVTDKENQEKLTAFISKLESLDDVQKVYTNNV
ncbi:MAG: YebC/PmpR family DNA-binding transcriptional regulator [Candidatus Levybacteria bacterium]|nr:YebC/PmpR family DNA-binding transcriptional regulator [Candidatus Levybacteria bacterium]